MPAAAHIFVANPDGTNTGKTGHVSGYVSTPIPAAALLLGSDLIGLVAIRKRFRK